MHWNVWKYSDLILLLPQPSDSYGCKCGVLCPYFYINNCHYNGARAVLQKVVFIHTSQSLSQTLPDFHSQHQEPEQQEGEVGRLETFDQEEFFGHDAAGHSMMGAGYLYIPSRWAHGQK